MKSKRKTGRDFDVRLGTAGSSADQIRRARRDLLALEKDRAEASKSTARELRSLSAHYRRDLSDLVGAGGMRQLRQLRKNRSTMTRAQRTRRIDALLNEEGVDRARLRRLQKTYADDARVLLSRGNEKPVNPPRLPGDCSPWVTYKAPYAGYFWSYHWQRTSNVSLPELTRHLDSSNGRIGSSIKTHVSGAGDDESLIADYYTGLNVWHTAQATGPLEAYLAFEFTTSSYSGKVKDEFGFSFAVWQQWAAANFLALESQSQFERQESRLLVTVDTAWGDDKDWSDYAEKPRDIHYYYFRTAATFEQGTSLLLEAGISTHNWFEADDESITLAEDVDLRLDRIMVRSCPAEIIL
jgi:hypothetical protein